MYTQRGKEEHMQIVGGHSMVRGVDPVVPVSSPTLYHLVAKIPKVTNAAIWLRELVALCRIRQFSCTNEPLVVANMFAHSIEWVSEEPTQVRLPAVSCNAREFALSVHSGEQKRVGGAMDTGLLHREWLTIFRGVLRATAELHRIGILHRDIKPANVLVMVTRRAVPRATTVFLCDYGHSVDYTTTQSTHDTYPVLPYGLCIGTLPYVPPEILGDIAAFTGTEHPIIQGRYTPFSDSWSLALAMVSIAHVLLHQADPLQCAFTSYVTQAQRMLARMNDRVQWEKDIYHTIRTVIDLPGDSFLSGLLFDGLLAMDPVQRVSPDEAYGRLEEYLARHHGFYASIGFHHLAYPGLPAFSGGGPPVVPGLLLASTFQRWTTGLGYPPGPIQSRMYRLFYATTHAGTATETIMEACLYIITAQYMPAVLDLVWPSWLSPQATLFPIIWAILDTQLFIV